MKKYVFWRLILTLFFFISISTNASVLVNNLTKDTVTLKNPSVVILSKKSFFAINPPVITAIGDQIYCPGSSIKIATGVTITHDLTESGTDVVYVQISSGYVNGQDKLDLANPLLHPTIKIDWIPSEGKLKLYSPTGIQITYTDFVSAIKDIIFTNSSPSPSGTRNFSINLGIGQANYLPSNGHFYEYISSPGITWTKARDDAAAKTYYGLQGYLATITAPDEAQLAGAQAAGAGWIGGSDAQIEGTWKWVTGPEGLTNGGGTTFWMGTGATGYVTLPYNYANWNTGEPNNQGNENYAHVTFGVGNPGSWNDLSNTGDPNPGSSYYPQGYIVEYGGMPGELPLQISTSTKITIPKITSTTPSQICGPGKVTLTATASDGIVNWYASDGTTSLGIPGNSFTTPVISITTTYYVDANPGCSTSKTPIIATVIPIPNITSTNSPVSRCGAGTVKLQATTDVGIINWYSTLNGGSSIGTGTSFTIPNMATSTTYYAEALNNGCSNGTRTAVEVKVYTPLIVADQEVTKCKSSTVTLNAGMSGMSYLWSPTGETSQKIIASNAGIYSVIVTSPTPENCSSTKKITVVEHDVPEINYIDVNGTTVVIYLKQEQVYFEYSIDGINYQNSNVFFNTQSGLQTAYVREKSSCSSATQTFIVLIIPKFFTPNNDTFNDFWEVKGLVNYPEAEVTIFDRYGKFIIQLNASKLTWDGTLNKYPLPASDYWYEVKIDNTKLKLRGHFTLKR